MKMPAWLPTGKPLRDGVLFVSGILGFAHETLIVGTERPSLLVAFGAMVGLPAFLRRDDKEGKP
jgi:hypothetical protein